jgi:Secretion system C-terminal sorting domain
VIRFFFIVVYFLLFPYQYQYLYAQQWVWVRSASGTYGMNDAVGNSVAIDANEHVFIAGHFDNATLTFGSYTLTNASGYDHVFVAKYDSGGNVLWAESAGGTGSDGASCVKTDTLGNVYITGSFNSPVMVFGSDTLTTISTTGGNVFLVKYAANGNVLWAKSAGGITLITDAVGTGLVLDVYGNVYLAGEYNSPYIIFGSDTLINTNRINGDIFLVKYDSNGNVIWAKNGFGIGEAGPAGFTIDGTGNLYLSGVVGDTTIFGSDTLRTSNSGGSMLLAKYDLNGNLLWATNSGGVGDAQASEVVTDVSGDVYVTGSFGIPFITFGADTLLCNHDWDAFIVKYDANGNALWAKSGDGPGSDNGNGIATDDNGNIIITGDFEAPYVAFGSDTLFTKGEDDIFLAKFAPNGNLIWTKSDGWKQGSDMSNDIILNENSDIYITGSYADTLAFGADTLFPNYGTVYLAKLTDGAITGENGIVAQNVELRIFPNPNNGNFIISLSGINEKCSIEIYNVLGEKIYTENLPQTQDNNINLTGQPNGVYLYRIISENGGLIGSGKLVITK